MNANNDDDDDDIIEIIDIPSTKKQKKRSLRDFFGASSSASSSSSLTSTTPAGGAAASLPALPFPPPTWGALIDEATVKRVKLRRFLGRAPLPRKMFTTGYRCSFNDRFNAVPGVGNASTSFYGGNGVRSGLSRGCLGQAGLGRGISSSSMESKENNGRDNVAAMLMDEEEENEQEEEDEEEEEEDAPGNKPAAAAAAAAASSHSAAAVRNFQLVISWVLAHSPIVQQCPAEEQGRLQALLDPSVVSPAALHLLWRCFHSPHPLYRINISQDQEAGKAMQELIERKILVDATQDEETLLMHLYDVLPLLRADELSRLVTAVFGAAGNSSSSSKKRLSSSSNNNTNTKTNKTRDDSLRTLEGFISQCIQENDTPRLRQTLGKNLIKWLKKPQEQQTFRFVHVEPRLSKLLQRVFALFVLTADHTAEDAVVLLRTDLGGLRFVEVDVDVSGKEEEGKVEKVDEKGNEGQQERLCSVGSGVISPVYTRFLDVLLSILEMFEAAVLSGDRATAYSCLHSVSDVFLPTTQVADGEIEPQKTAATATSTSTNTHTHTHTDKQSTSSPPYIPLSVLEANEGQTAGRLLPPPGYRGLHDLPRPLFKRVISVLGRGVHLLERDKSYQQALHYLRIALEGTKHMSLSLRAHFWRRLVLDLGHLNRGGEALDTCEKALNDPCVDGEDRLFLQNKCMSMCVPPRRWKKPSFPLLVAGPVVNIELGGLRERRGLVGGKSLEERVLEYLLGEEEGKEERGGGGEGNEEVQVVEQGEGNGRGTWRGSHCENGVYLTLFGLLCWDVLWEVEGVPCAAQRVFPSKYQNAPQDLFYSRQFLEASPARQRAFDVCLARLRAGEAPLMLAEVYEKYAGCVCVGVDWQSFSLRELQFIARGLGGEVLVCVCNTLMKDYSLFSHGFPDLLLWREEVEVEEEKNGVFVPAVRLVEVKGPGDSLSHAQMFWIDALLQCGGKVRVEVAKVTNA